MDIDYLRKFIPYSEMEVIMENPDAYETELERVERQIRAMPTPERVADEDAITVGMHYFGGTTDFWVYAMQEGGEYAEAFVCLNGDVWNAECGPVYIPELLPIPLINLDLHWNADTKLSDIIENVKG